MEIPDYGDYQFEDFIMDADFRAWVTNPTPDTDAFWRQFISTHPEQSQTIQEAIWAVQHLTIEPHTLPTDAKERIWKTLDKAYDEQYPGQAEQEPIIRPMPVTRRSWFRVAASLTGVLMIAGAAWYLMPTRHTVETAFTETKTVSLPDGSIVTLNRNSTLTYDDNWSGDKPREVWVSGEAFFAVHRNAVPQATKPTRPSDAFVVHTDLMEVEVLGTQFDLNTRRGKARIVLNEGKVKLTREREGVVQSMLMQPGDRVDVTHAASDFVKRRVAVDEYDSWRNGQLRFDHTPIADIITVLEDTYGWKVTLRKPKLGRQTFSATVPSDQPDLLLRLLTESFGVHIHRSGQNVTIE
jgi:transmembrane sensor